MVGILGNSGGCSHDTGACDGLSASLVKEINLVVAFHSNFILERDFIGATVIEISDELEKVDIPVGNRRRCGRRKEDGTNGKGLEERGGHRDESMKGGNK